jgi:hypothetical protein
MLIAHKEVSVTVRVQHILAETPEELCSRITITSHEFPRGLTCLPVA